jgi:hypothetical protein
MHFNLDTARSHFRSYYYSATSLSNIVQEAELDAEDVLMKRGISSSKGKQTPRIHDIANKSAD